MSLFEQITEAVEGRVVILGVGNTLRADDGAGCLVARRLAETHPSCAFDVGETPENFAGPVRRARPGTLIFVDAADFEGTPGETRLATPDDIGGLMIGTHAAPLGLFMRAVGEDMDCRTILLAIQAASTALDGELTAAVEDAIDATTETLLRILDLHGG